MWDDIKVILILILVFVVFTVSLCALINPFIRMECNAMTKDIGLPHRYSFFGGCQVQENGQWIPLDNWRYFGDQ